MEVLTGAIRQEKEINSIGKKKIKLSLFADNMILYIEESKDSIKRLLELIREFGKSKGYKINECKLMALVYTNNSMTEKELLRTISF